MLSIAERHKYILDSLNKHGFVRITDVANELGVTKVTIRKDIKILESKGLLYKVHGSARPANPHVADLDVHVKDNINRDAKRRIAQRAAEMLGETDSIIVASGSTVYAFAEEIKMRMWHHLNIVTPFLRLGVLLNESENVNIVQLGGSDGPQEVAFGAGRGGRTRAGRLHLLEGLLRGGRHRPRARHHDFDDRRGETHAADDARRLAGHRADRLVEIRTARFRPHLRAGGH